MWWREESDKFFFKLHLKFRESNTEARVTLACVADALNLLFIAKGLDECVGRLQRRLV